MTKELQDVVREALEDIESDAELCAAYPSVCAYATSEEYRKTIIYNAVRIMATEKMQNPFDALEILDTQLSDAEQ